jgi:hypothetical protein
MVVPTATAIHFDGLSAIRNLSEGTAILHVAPDSQNEDLRRHSTDAKLSTLLPASELG